MVYIYFLFFLSFTCNLPLRHSQLLHAITKNWKQQKSIFACRFNLEWIVQQNCFPILEGVLQALGDLKIPFTVDKAFQFTIIGRKSRKRSKYEQVHSHATTINRYTGNLHPSREDILTYCYARMIADLRTMLQLVSFILFSCTMTSRHPWLYDIMNIN